MKPLLINTRLVAIALVAVFAVAFTTPALADDGKNPVPLELKYLGEFKSQPVFELTFNNDNEYVVVIRDEANNVIHKEFVKGGTASRKYMITNELNDISLFQFEVINRQTDKKSVFQINKNTRVVEDLVVNRIK